ncbi:MAG: hypothetical protein Q9160_003576 [Pyrenula sp. 1 TL-2023]
MSTPTTPSLPTTHRALLLTSRSSPLTLLPSHPLPPLTPGSALIRVLATHVISYTRDVLSGARPYPFPTPLVPGGMCVGRVAAVGPDATTLSPGQLVYVQSFLVGRDNPDVGCMLGFFSGSTAGTRRMVEGEWRDGTLAEYVRVPLENCVGLDEGRLLAQPEPGVGEGGLGYTVEDLAYLQTPMIVYGGLRDIELRPGETVVVAPATGGFGGAAVQVALAMGAGRVIAMGRNEEALRRVGGLDGERVRTLRIVGDDWEGELAGIKALALGGVVDAFFDISPPGALGSSHFKAGILALRRNGRVSFMSGVRGDLPLPMSEIMHRNLKLRGKWMYDREDIQGFMKLVHSGLLKLGAQGGNEITGRFGLEGWKEAFDLAAEKAQVGQMAVIVP